jgi:uncharacterized small protein (DUF1192 family)
MDTIGNDAINLIMTALSLGVASGLKDAATDTVKDGIHRLKALLQRKAAGRSEASVALAKYEEKPDVWEAPLRDELIHIGADRDEEILEAAKHLLTLVNPQQAAMGKYNVQITGPVQGFVQGDEAKVDMKFGGLPPDE